MRKVRDQHDVLVGQFFAVSAEQLDVISARLKNARKERTNPGEAMLIEVANGLYFYEDPHILRSDLERQIRIDRPMGVALPEPAFEQPSAFADVR